LKFSHFCYSLGKVPGVPSGTPQNALRSARDVVSFIARVVHPPSGCNSRSIPLAGEEPVWFVMP
jgi:hypothetical protein